MTEKTAIALKTESHQDSTIVITATIDADLVAKHQNDSMLHLGHDLTIKGFRRGKAPLNVLKENLDPQKVTNHTLEHIFPEIIKEVFKQHQLKIIGNPTLTAVTTPNQAPWTVTLSFPLLPEFEIKGYQDKLKKAYKDLETKTKKDPKSKTKSDDKTQTPKDPQSEKLTALLDTLLKEIELTVPESLITQEVNQSLVRLYDHTQALGITVDQYLKSLGKTAEQIKQDYHQAATENLKIEFILDRIATDLDIAVNDDEITDMINASGDQQAKDQLNHPEQRAYVKGIIKKRKTIDALLNL